MANVFDLYGKISIDTSGFLTALSVAKKAISAAATGITNFAKSSIMTGQSFDKSMSQVAATMGKNVDEIDDLREFAKKMGSETAFSASQAADALNYMALAGYDAQTSMNMLPNVLNLAASGGMELARASDMITDTQSALGLSLDETAKLVDKMAKGASKTNTSVGQLGDAMLTVGGTAKMLSGGTTELATALGLLADNGTKGAEGGTALRNIILSLSAPTDKAAAALEDLGVQAFDNNGKMRDLQSIFADFNSALSDMTDAEKTQTLNSIFNKVDLKSVNALLATSTERWNEVSAAIDNADGAAAQMAETQLDNLAGDITIFQSALEGVQIALSDKLTPTLRKFVKFGTDGLSKLTKAFNEKGLKGAMSEFGSIISDGLLMIVEMTPDILEVGSAILSSIGQGILDNLSMLLDVVMKVIQQIILDLGRALPALVAALPAFIETLINSIDWDNLLDIIINVVEIIADALIDTLPLLTESILTLVEKVVEFVLKPNTLSNLVELCAKVMIAVSTALLAAAPKLLVGVGKIIKVVVDNIINTDWNELGQGLMNNINKAISKAAEKLMVWWDGWSQEIAKYAVIAYESVVKKWSEFGQFFVDLWNGVVSSWDWFWEQWRHGLQTMWDNVVNTFRNIGDFFKGIWDSIVSTFTTIGTKVGEAIGGAFKIAINAVIGTVEGALNAIPNTINGMLGAINAIPGVEISMIPTVTLPRLAQGGVLKKGQVGYLEGDGDEAVVPLSQNTEWIDRVADKISEKSGNSATYIFNFNIDNVSGNREDMEDNADLLMQIFTEKMSRMGVVFA